MSGLKAQQTRMFAVLFNFNALIKSLLYYIYLAMKGKKDYQKFAPIVNQIEYKFIDYPGIQYLLLLAVGNNN